MAWYFAEISPKINLTSFDCRVKSLISPYFLKATIPLIYSSTRAFLYKGTVLHLTPNSLPSLCPYFDLFSLLLSFFVLTSCFPLYSYIPTSSPLQPPWLFLYSCLSCFPLLYFYSSSMPILVLFLSIYVSRMHLCTFL